MANLLNKLTDTLQQLYRRTHQSIEAEREFVISQKLLNATLQRYVTDNVRMLKDLHAEIHDDWLRLYATIHIAGIFTSLSVDLKLVQMEFNHKKQLLVFEQISKTQVIKAHFDHRLQKWGANAALYVYQQLLDKDPLGPILQKYKLVEVKHGLIYLSLHRWLGKFDALRKFNINHGVLRPHELVVYANVNLNEILNRVQKNVTEKQTAEKPDTATTATDTAGNNTATTDTGTPQNPTNTQQAATSHNNNTTQSVTGGNT